MAITRQPRQFLAVWNDEGTEVKGSTFEESIFVDGAFWKNELSSIAPERFSEFGLLFSNQLQTQHDSLVAEKADLLAQNAILLEEKTAFESRLTIATEAISSLTDEKNALMQSLGEVQSQVTILQSQLAALTNAKATVDASLATRTAELAVAQSRIEFLTNELPFDPREISVTAFRERLAKVLDPLDLISLYASEANPILKEIAATIDSWPITDPIRLDSPELLQPLEILFQYEILYAEEIDSLRLDATRNEAYFANL